MTSSSQALEISLFDLVQAQFGDTMPAITCTKAALIHLVHTLETIVQTEELDALLLVGFQDAEYWRAETDRYDDLTATARHICVFAGGSMPRERSDKHLYVQLADDDLLKREWFLLILCNRFSVLLAAKDRLTATDNELGRQFDVFWTFNIPVILAGLDILEGAIEHYRAEKLPDVQQMRSTYKPMMPPDIALIARFTQSFIQYEEQLNAQLKWQKHLTDTLLASISPSLYVCQLEPSDASHTIYASPNLETLTGYSLAEMGDIWSFSAQKGIHPEDYPVLQQSRPLWFREGGQGVLEYRYVRADGEIILLQDTMTVEVDPVTQVKTIYGVLEDISRERAQETEMLGQERLRIELQKERELNALRMRFMTNISHEFRTPLATILSSVELLVNYADRISTESRDSKLQTILNQVMHLRQMLDDISIILDDEIGRMGFHPVPLAVQHYLEECIQDFERAHKNDRHMVFEHDGNTAEYLADARLLNQVLVNLLSNAVKFSPPGSTVTCSLTLHETQMTLTIADEGIGIPEEDRKHLFEPFFRGSNIGTVGGTGLGLRIVRDCVQIQGGRITVNSALGEGTIVTVKIPMAPA